MDLPAPLGTTAFPGGHMVRAFLCATVAVTTLAASTPYAANERQAGETISVSAVVIDKNGVPIRNLRASDFTLREDGKPVSVTAFSATNAVETSSVGRSIVLVLGGQTGTPS